MAKNLGFIDIVHENNLFNNNLPDLAVNLGKVKGTNTAAGQIEQLANSSSSDTIDWYRFELDTTAPVNSYIELSSFDVVNINARYAMGLYRYDAVNDQYQLVDTSYQLENTPFNFRIDLASLGAGTYVFGVVGAEWAGRSATGLYNLRMSIPTPTQLGKVLNGTNNGDRLSGGNEENTINGNAGNDTLSGGGGDDTLNGGDGNDILTGGADGDVLNGGAGIDRLVEVDPNPSSASFDDFNFHLGNSYLIGNGVDFLTGIEQAQLTGGNRDNLLDASAFTLGSVTLDGGAGNDKLLGGTQNDRLIGGEGFGSDTLDGGAGKDTLIGGNGGTTYFVDNLGDVVVETSTIGFDQVHSSVSFSFGANLLEDLTLTGTAAINGTGNSLNNRLTGNSASNNLNAGEGNDSLDGGGGIDTLIGGLGNDFYTVDNSADVIIETSSTDFDVVRSNATSYTLGANLENLELGAGLNGTGNNLVNKMFGNDANNVLSGGGGNDTLYGFNGNDTLNGGDGNDYLNGSFGNDVINGGNGDDHLFSLQGKATLNGGAGADYLDGGIDDGDTYVFQFGQSSVFATDMIDGFAIGSDKIDLLTQGGAALGKPNSLTRAADSDSFDLEEVVNQVFTDANGKLAGNQALGINSAALVKYSIDFYLIVNDGTAGFQANNDLVIRTWFLNEPDFGAVPVDSIFI